MGLIALAAAWYGGEHFILRQVRMLYYAAERLAAGDLGTRTGLAREREEPGNWPELSMPWLLRFSAG